MRIKPGIAVRLILRDGTTVSGVSARSRQFGVHRLNRVHVYSRIEPERVKGYLLVPDRNVLFAQVSPPDIDED